MYYLLYCYKMLSAPCAWSFSTAWAGICALWRLSLSDLKIIQVSKLILVINGESEIHVWHGVHLSAELLLKRSHKGGNYFHARIFGHASEVAFHYVRQSQQSKFNRLLNAINISRHLASMTLIIFVIWVG